MENIECKNCASTQFKTDSNGIICLYCATPYIEKEEKKTETVITHAKLSNKAVLWTIFGTILVFFIGIFAFSNAKSHRIVEVQKVSPDSKLSQEEYGYKYINDAGGWNKQAYDDIKRAKGHLNENGEWEDYKGGTLYSELVQQVGEPSSLHEDLDRNEVTAIWSQNPTSPHVLWINVTYDKKTEMIISKNIQGWSAE